MQRIETAVLALLRWCCAAGATFTVLSAGGTGSHVLPKTEDWEWWMPLDGAVQRASLEQ